MLKIINEPVSKKHSLKSIIDMSKFARILESKKHKRQLLVYVCHNEDHLEDGCESKLVYATEFDSAFISISMGFETDEIAKEQLEKVDQDFAEEFLKDPFNYINSML